MSLKIFWILSNFDEVKVSEADFTIKNEKKLKIAAILGLQVSLRQWKFN